MSITVREWIEKFNNGEFDQSRKKGLYKKKESLTSNFFL